MKYPNLPARLDKRKKLTSKDISLIKKMIKDGKTLKEITKIFNISDGTVLYHTKGDEYKKKWKEKVKARISDKMKTDDEFREKKKEIDSKSKKRKRKILKKEVNEYHRQVNKKWRSTERGKKRWREYNEVFRGKKEELSKEF